MNKHLWILGLMTVSATLAGCSADDAVSSSAGDGAAVEVVGNSNVEIRLSSHSSGTRSSVESDKNGLFEAEGLGIFCLAEGELKVNPNEQPISWIPAAENFSVWMDNVEADAVMDSEACVTSIEWTDGMKRWYPTGNWYRYQFYGYYPRVENIVYGETSCQAIIDLDGTQDVIWGRTQSDDPDAFSAKYFRKSVANSEEIPAMALSHKLMRLTFSCVPGADAKGSIESALTMGVKSIVIKNVPSVGYLTIADRSNHENDGVMQYDWAYNLADFVLRDSLDADFGERDHWVQEEKTTLGQGIMLPVPEDPDYHYYVQVVLMDKEGNTFYSEHPIELQSVSGGYAAGKSYNVNMTIHGPQQIYLNATLAPWDTDTDGTVGEITL